jgi:carboxyl-terminal processing protease
MKFTFQRLIYLLFILSSTAMATEAGDEVRAESGQPLSPTQLSLDDLRTFTDVFNQVRINFVEDVDDHTLMNAAIRGMLSELDPHSSYMEADEFRQLDNDSRGRYSGIGVEVSIQDKHVNVVAVMDDGAASRAGVVAGDIITSIDGKTVRGHNMQSSINGLRGEAGSEVRITLEHQNGEVSEHTLVRDYVRVSSVFSRPVDGDYGYFQITHFTRQSADELKEQVDYMLGNHGGSLKGVVLDLRNNPGGVLKSAVTMADGFLDEGLIVYTHGRSPNQMEYRAHEGQWLPDTPVVVLVNGSSASASEVLAGALQDHDRALILGERTFGKGSVQSVLNLRNGSGIRLTTSRYYTPSGRSIQAEGIHPDVEIPSLEIVDNKDHRKREADLDRHLNGEPENNGEAFDSDVSAADDYAMYQALILLKGTKLLSRQ